MRLPKKISPYRVALILVFALLGTAVIKSLSSWSGFHSFLKSRSVKVTQAWQPGRQDEKTRLLLGARTDPSSDRESSHAPAKTCQKKTNVVFLKVHKAGSTTLSNMFFRFALRHGLNIALPNKRKNTYGFNVLGEKTRLTPSMLIPVAPGQTYNIMANHVFYNRTAFEKIMPSDTLRIAIVREPESQFVSAAHYYQLVKKLHNMDAVVPANSRFVFSKWLKNPWKIGVSQEVCNSQAADFGLPHPVPRDPHVLEAFLDQTARDFRLVMLLEYMDESIVLLRRILCWEMRDVVHIRVNVNNYKHDVSFHHEDRKRLRKWLHADFRLYEMSSQRFWKELHSQGTDFFDEVVFFRQVLRQVEDFCKYENTGEQKRGLTIPRSKWSEEFSVTIKDCHLMTKSELALQGELIDRAWSLFSGRPTEITPPVTL